jgi:hypothetical protein
MKREIVKTDGQALDTEAEPPVVARLVVEIRSDGRRTIARGALENAAAGEQVAIQADGTTPLALAMALVRSLVRLLPPRRDPKAPKSDLKIPPGA